MEILATDIFSTLQRLLTAESFFPFEIYQQLVKAIVLSGLAWISFQDTPTLSFHIQVYTYENSPEDMLRQDSEIDKYFPFDH